ncbi:MAG: murein biosynthesis integral membrane protein MurJ [Alphaproteobacteria bacterium]|nr:murein biosynthesis integral membrane protein MurJ [Alphaproteobacteria bacterium]
MIFLKKFLTVSGMTLLSRILGVVREMILSIYLGASVEMDTCLVAMKFPKFFKKCFSEEGLHSVFVPSLAGLEVQNKKKFAKLFSSEVFSIICYISIIVTTLVVIFAKYFVIFMAPGFANDPEKLSLTIEFTRIMFPSVIFLSLQAIYGGVLVSNQRFGLYTVSPLIMNVVLITAILLSKNGLHPGRGLAYGVLSATIIQYLYLYSILKKNKLTTPHFVIPKLTNSVKQFFKKLAPVIASAGVAQINVFIDSFFSSYLFTGCITYLYFADRLNQFPLSIFGISMSIVLLPEISRIMAKKNTDNNDQEIQNICKESILFTLRLTLPVVVVIASLSYYFIDVIYGYGKFTKFDVSNTATVLSIMSLGLPAYVLSKILSAIFFAQKNTKAPIRAAIAAICSNLILNALLMKKFQFAGIAIATMISGYLQMFILSKHLGKADIFNRQFVTQISKIFLSTLLVHLAVILSKHYIIINHSNTIINNLLILATYSSIGLIVYTFSLYLLKDKAVIDILNKIKK